MIKELAAGRKYFVKWGHRKGGQLERVVHGTYGDAQAMENVLRQKIMSSMSLDDAPMETFGDLRDFHRKLKTGRKRELRNKPACSTFLSTWKLITPIEKVPLQDPSGLAYLESLRNGKLQEFIRLYGYMRAATKAALDQKRLKKSPLLTLCETRKVDTQLLHWRRHSQCFIDNPGLRDFLQMTRFIPLSPTFLAGLRTSEIKMVGHLIYYGPNDQNFFPIPKYSLQTIKQRLAEPMNDLVFSISPSELRRQWQQTSRDSGTTILLESHLRFAANELMQQMVPRQAIEVFNPKLDISYSHNMALHNLQTAQQGWVRSVKLASRAHCNRPPELDPYGFHSIADYKIPLALLFLSKADPFENLQETTFLSSGRVLVLKDLVRQGFGELAKPP
jgi:hypothetical protein